MRRRHARVAALRRSRARRRRRARPGRHRGRPSDHLRATVGPGGRPSSRAGPATAVARPARRAELAAVRRHLPRPARRWPRPTPRRPPYRCDDRGLAARCCRRRRPRRRLDRSAPRAASLVALRPRTALEHVRLDGVAEVGPPVSAQPLLQRRGDRRLPRADGSGPRGHDPAAALLLRPVRAALAPLGGSLHRGDRCIGRRPVLHHCAPGRDERRRRAAHPRAARAGRSGTTRPSPRCAWSRSPVAGCHPPTSVGGHSALRRGAPTST